MVLGMSPVMEVIECNVLRAVLSWNLKHMVLGMSPVMEVIECNVLELY